MAPVSDSTGGISRILDAGSAPAVAGPTTRGFKERLVAYKDLAKLEIFDVYLTVPLAASLLSWHELGRGRNIAILGLMLLTQLGVLTAACAFDDVAGVRDGIDTFNYGEGETLRKRKRKPLLDNRLTERQALRYAYVAASVGVACCVAAYAVADFRPAWIPLLAAVVVAAVLFYSWGPRLSYIGGQELVVVLGFMLTLVGTYALLTGYATWRVVLEGLMLGVWLMTLTAFANLHDREGDGRAGRVTMAVRLDTHAYRVYLAAHFAAGLAILGVGLATGSLPWQLAPLLGPALLLELSAFRDGVVRGDGLRGRATSLNVLRLGWLALLVANVIA